MLGVIHHLACENISLWAIIINYFIGRNSVQPHHDSKYQIDDFLFVEVFEWKFRYGASFVLFNGSGDPFNLSDVILVSCGFNFHEVDFICHIFKLHIH